ncbi:hypothetical protein CKF54_05420 [Psittacicella hinzii]|uniref:Uncharacterized protein n=1 Tax=Psittacicella hinzii TaxID=2028575 RepID=A0A3A1Y3R5_9GAMM|nr:hypothetical protein [Psittacicella hinzii]RIY32091.1 hypothetical protein CKF54_05420 [Psittacicella hinzii]
MVVNNTNIIKEVALQYINLRIGKDQTSLWVRMAQYFNKELSILASKTNGVIDDDSLIELIGKTFSLHIPAQPIKNRYAISSKSLLTITQLGKSYFYLLQLDSDLRNSTQRDIIKFYYCAAALHNFNECSISTSILLYDLKAIYSDGLQENYSQELLALLNHNFEAGRFFLLKFNGSDFNCLSFDLNFNHILNINAEYMQIVRSIWKEFYGIDVFFRVR